MFGSVEALNAALLITGENFADTEAALEAMKNSTGATKEAFDTMSAGIGFQMNIMSVGTKESNLAKNMGG